jgi:hypothetical protein
LSVALSGDGETALVGEPGDKDRVGAAWVFARTGSRWTRQAKLVGGGEVGMAEFGFDVALSADGNTALVGGPDDNRRKDLVGNTGYGAAWVFTRTGTTWHQQGKKLTGRGETPTGLFGFAVALSAAGDTALIGAAFADDRGAAWVFPRTHSTWRQQGGKLFGTGATGSHVPNFGAAVALSAKGDIALISGGDDNNQIGSVWFFRRSGSTWRQLGSKLTPRGHQGQSQFGSSVALSASGDIALIGGWIDHDGPARLGSSAAAAQPGNSRAPNSPAATRSERTAASGSQSHSRRTQTPRSSAVSETTTSAAPLGSSTDEIRGR